MFIRDSSETDLIYPAELQEEEQYRRYFKDALELEILEQGYPADKADVYKRQSVCLPRANSTKRLSAICWSARAVERI